MADAELRVSSTKLQGFLPFPTWNGTVSAPDGDSRGLCSVLGAEGELVVLQNSRNDECDSWLRVLKVLSPAVDKFSSFCQCWTRGAAVVATAHDRSLTFYDSEDFRVLARLRLRYSVTAMDITQRRRNGDGDDVEYMLVVGTSFGCFLYKVSLSSGLGAAQVVEPVASAHKGVAVCMVKFSHDGSTAALGSLDGRLFMQRLNSHDDDALETFGSSVLSRVLAAPRVTSMSFSACSTKLVVATRKGNVYVYTRVSETGQWQSLTSCQHLSANPKPKAGGAAGVSKAATAAQTLVACWGPVFVVCSRVITSRLEVYDFDSGRLLRSLQVAPATSAVLNQWVDQQLVTGVCGWQLPSGHWRLLCHDTSAKLAVVQWPFLDVIQAPLR
ncbi:hypothetical protein PRIC1_003981 [Phytophthora ramorum]|uniref:uncharacterized protein n=1 Tax=Phytophthora ramorum TaxID=164328 RepID=UPI00309504A8|nr:hypothetical protein KRP23_3721 [Phytophthora ramorum]KAH7507947.1 hypothetical protein KRP22_3041 [Phytophthora ramorum]